MSFEFQTKDEIQTLPEKLLAHFPSFLSKRFVDLEVLKAEVFNEKFSGLSNFCHKQLGIAASYHLYQYEELVQALVKARKENNTEQIIYLINEIEEYLVKTKSFISK